MLPAVALARHRLSQYGPPPLCAGRCAAWALRHFGATVLLGQSLPPRVRAHLTVLPDLGALILVSAASPWPRWSIVHELAHLDTGAIAPQNLTAVYWRRVPYERIANRYAAELAAPQTLVANLLYTGRSLTETANALGVPTWVIERQAQRTRLLIA